MRTLGFLSMEDDEYARAVEYLKAALAIDPNDKKSANLLKMSEIEIKKE